ncbi:serine hydrolase domain-containing protein [Caulobacter sp. BK020]|uniref:serine hydrolase domain-containing protein n=1 Tax=Caulobacter sp. BK020 TaxID=2512117 RepID=UPI001050563A|nr:serine hydrolase domain-containing protein [Caulobacter sp. BK020]TCS12649.1 CubicO group peptidase (beta-lactamase class C family) [Caulobacter sp. BK020]
MRIRLTMAAALAIALAPITAHAAPESAPAAILALERPDAAGFSPERLKRLDGYMQGLVDQGHLPGAITLVARHGKVVSYQTFGKTAIGGKPMTRDTIFRIYSQTKPVTGVAMMILFEEGRWRLDDPVTKFVPELANLQVYKGQNPDGTFITEPAARPPTLREIMSHTGGFAYGLRTDQPVEKAYRDSGLLGSKTQAEFLTALAKLPLASQPGTEWRYSVSVDLQGLIVERLSGMSLADFMKSRIFDPLKMTDTAFWVPAAKSDRLAALYMIDPKARKRVPADGFMVLDVSKPPAIASGGGGLVSTTADYARFAQMLLNGGELDGARILAPGTIELMASNHLTDIVMAVPDAAFSPAKGEGFGLDFAVVTDPARAGTLRGKGTYSWGGAAGTWFWIDPKNDLFMLGMIHILGKDADPALAHIDENAATLVYQALVDPAK